MDRVTSNAAECDRLVREQDPDRAVSILFAPAGKRADLLALYAFNIETARIREQISQPLPGEIRLQWWRDLIAATGSGSDQAGGQGHPVAEALTQTIVRCGLPADAFDRFLEARIFDLYDDPMPSRVDFEAYAGGTASALIMLSAMILDRAGAPKVAEAAGHAGVAQAATGALRLLPIHRSRRHILIPADILAAAGCTADALLHGEPDATGRAVKAMAAFSREHLARYRERRATIPAGLRPSFLPAEMTGTYLDRIESGGLAEIDAPATVNPLRRSWTYWRAMRR